MPGHQLRWARGRDSLPSALAVATGRRLPKAATPWPTEPVAVRNRERLFWSTQLSLMKSQPSPKAESGTGRETGLRKARRTQRGGRTPHRGLGRWRTGPRVPDGGAPEAGKTRTQTLHSSLRGEAALRDLAFGPVRNSVRLPTCGAARQNPVLFPATEFVALSTLRHHMGSGPKPVASFDLNCSFKDLVSK